MVERAEKEIWVVGDLRNKRLFGFSLNVLAKARELAQSISGKAVVVLMGSSDSDGSKDKSKIETSLLLDNAAEECFDHGADVVYVLDSPGLAIPRADLYARVLTKTISKMNPMVVLFTLTDFMKELAARCAGICNAGLIADCDDLRLKEGELVATCPAWGGEVMCELAFCDTSSTGFATVQPHAAKAVAARVEGGKKKRIDVGFVDESHGVTLISRLQEPAGRRKLEEAGVVVVGGAGMGNADGFGLVRKLAVSLGGEVGATRPPVSQHWIDEERLIGQTGKAVRPELLFSVGTSGAVQYTAGIMESKTIVAINRDPSAPIFQIADLGIVADAKTFLPVLTTKIKQAVMREILDVWSEDKKSRSKEDFGAKVHKLRKTHDWSLQALAESSGESPEFIEQVEKNEIVPSVSFLLRLSKTLGVDPGTFLRDEDKVAIQDKRAQAFTTRTKNYYYQTLTPGVENEHLRAFMVTIEPKQTHKPVAYKHEGEEFVYVMEGSMELTLGNKTSRLKQGESQHFNSDIPHKLKSLGSELTRCLVILYTP